LAGPRLGEALLRSIAGDRSERRILLSTPEGENRAWRLYRRLGFTDVLRHYRFTGDPRPFGVLGRELPLAPRMPAQAGMENNRTEPENPGPTRS
jgi:ribosomal protein S18 acetylase RimI-like enzyme